MAITFVAAGANKTAASGNLASIGLPAGLAAGDFMLLVVSEADSVTPTLATWNTLSAASGAMGSVGRQTVFWKIAVAGETAPTVTHSAGNSIEGRIMAWRGVDAANPIGSVSTLNTGIFSGGSATITANGITPASGNSAIVMVATSAETATGGAVPNNFASWSGTNPTLVEVNDTGVQLGTMEAESGAAWGLSNTGAATGNRTVALSSVDPSANSGWAASLIELLPGTSTVVSSPLPPRIHPLMLMQHYPKLFAYPILDTTPASAPGPQTFLQDLTATINFTGSLQNQTSKLMSAVINMTGSVVKQVNKPISALINMTSTIQKQVNKPLSATINITASIQKQASKILTGNLTFTPSLIKQVNKPLSAVINFTASIQALKVIIKVMSATINFTGSIQKNVFKNISANLTFSASIQSKINKLLSAGINFTSSIQKQVNKPLSAVINFTASVQALKVIIKVMSATINFTSSIQKTVQKNLTANLTFTPNMGKLITKTLVASITFTANMAATLKAAGGTVVNVVRQIIIGRF